MAVSIWCTYLKTSQGGWTSKNYFFLNLKLSVWLHLNACERKIAWEQEVQWRHCGIAVIGLTMLFVWRNADLGTLDL